MTTYQTIDRPGAPGNGGDKRFAKHGTLERKAWERAGKNQKKCFSGLWDQDAASSSLATRTMKNGCFREKTTVFWILSMFFRPLLMHSLKYIMFVSLS
mgnify:CR=1 FL=1